MRALQRIHLYVGLIGIIVFAATGQYMDIALDHLRGMDATPRMLYRSAHIYLLLVSVINVVMGVYAEREFSGWQRLVQLAASLMFLFAPLFMLAAFFLEPLAQDIDRTYAQLALYGVFGVGVATGVVGLVRRWARD